MTLCRVSGIAALLLLLSRPLLPAIAASSDCDRALRDGTSLQKSVDAMYSNFARDPHREPEQRDQARAAQLYFDSLCRLDAAIGTREGERFFDEEVDRAARILHRW